jgi:hypothetical protein
VFTLSVPADQAAGLAGALEQLRDVSDAPRREPLEEMLHELGGGTLTAPIELLAELLAVAIDEAGEALSDTCTALLRGSASVAEVRARVTGLGGLLDLLERVAKEAEPRRGPAVDVERLPGDEAGGG